MKQEQPIDYKYNWKLYFDLVKKYKWLIFGIFFFLTVSEAGRIVVDFMFKYLVDYGTKYANGSITKDIFVKVIIALSLFYIINQLIRAFSRWFYIHIVNRFEENVKRDMKEKFFNHLLGLHYGFHTSIRTGSMISKLIRGAGAIEKMSDIIIFSAAPLLIQLILVSTTLLFLDPMSAVLIFIVVAVFVAYSMIVNRLHQKALIISNDAEDLEKANISDMFTNIESIKYFGKENLIKEKYSGLCGETRRTQIIQWDYYRYLESGQIIIIGFGTMLILSSPIIGLITGRITLGTVIFIYTAYSTVYGQLFGFVNGIKNYYKAMGDFESLFKFYKIKNEIKDSENAKDFKVKDGEIEFKNVSFSYKKRKIFDKFNLKVPKGKRIALVGSSGAGKSSMIKILYRLYDVDSGEILIDGENIKTFKQESFREGLSIVPQECVLFDDTVYNNIAFSKPGAKKEEVLQAMKFAQLDKIVHKFPNKEKTIVGERGIKLSGGEKQRVSIARAILADKKILVLDEATSSLDSETESEIQKDLHRLMQGRTSIIIAHRLSTVMRADTIIVIDEGKIVQKGTHNELIKKDGTYKKLWNLQKGGYLQQTENENTTSAAKHL